MSIRLNLNDFRPFTHIALSLSDPHPRILSSMFTVNPRNSLLVHLFIVLSSFLMRAPFAHAWGNEGHRIINHLAAANLPSDAPSFLRSDAAISQIEYLGPEPDRWRSPAEPVGARVLR